MAQTVANQTPAELDSTRGGFKIGDNVVYPTQGAGRIVDEVERVIGGKTMQFFELELLKGSTKVLIPKGQETRWEYNAASQLNFAHGTLSLK